MLGSLSITEICGSAFLSPTSINKASALAITDVCCHFARLGSCLSKWCYKLILLISFVLGEGRKKRLRTTAFWGGLQTGGSPAAPSEWHWKGCKNKEEKPLQKAKKCILSFSSLLWAWLAAWFDFCFNSPFSSPPPLILLLLFHHHSFSSINLCIFFLSPL